MQVPEPENGTIREKFTKSPLNEVINRIQAIQAAFLKTKLFTNIYLMMRIIETKRETITTFLRFQNSIALIPQILMSSTYMVSE